MNLQEHYNQLYIKSSAAILSRNYDLDIQLHDATDTRLGITLVIRPSEKIKAQMQLFLDELKAIEPNQYYYPDSDIHITVMSLISCYEGFSLDKINIEDYKEIIQKSLIDINKIKINFKGITASPSAIMIQGFPDETLNILRNNLRTNFKKSTLEQSLDKRYSITTAHCTVMRFQEKLQNPEQLIAIAEKFREFDFGDFIVENIELVCNDWYQREENSIHLTNFGL